MRRSASTEPTPQLRGRRGQGESGEGGHLPVEGDPHGAAEHGAAAHVENADDERHEVGRAPVAVSV